MEIADEVAAEKVELQILRQLSAYKDKIETSTAYPLTSDGMVGLKNDKDGAGRYHPSPRICGAPVRCGVPTSIAQHSLPRLQTRPGGCKSVTTDTTFRIPPAAVLSHQTKGGYKGIPPAGVPNRTPVHMPGSNQQVTTPRVKPGVSLNMPDQVAMKYASHLDPTSFKGSTPQLHPAAQSVRGVATPTTKRFFMDQSPRHTPHFIAGSQSKPHSALTGNKQAAVSQHSSQQQNLRSAVSRADYLGGHKDVGDAHRETRCDSSSAGFPVPLSAVSPHEFEVFKLQLGAHFPIKRMGERKSILSSGSTCSSVGSRRRPWE
ncbi:hypothetical protein Emed_005723 [Eimeria media]